MCCHQGARPLWEASFPGAVSSHGADSPAPGRGTLPTRRHWWQYLCGSRWPLGAVHPWECKSMGLKCLQHYKITMTFTLGGEVALVCFLLSSLMISMQKVQMCGKSYLRSDCCSAAIWKCFLIAGWYRCSGEGSFTGRQCSQSAQYPGHHHCTCKVLVIIRHPSSPFF